MARKKSNRSRLAALGRVAKQFDEFAPGNEVLTPVNSVPTIFPQFDLATNVGGCPLQRVVLVHGPSNHGKTVFLHGLGRSFLEREHFYGFVDAEYTTPRKWVGGLLKQCADYPSFVAMRPKTYEQTRAAVRDMLDKIVKAREAGDIPEDTAALIGVDSIRKLIPKDLVKKVAEADKGVDGAGGRAGQIKAAQNAAWMDELVPLAYHANATILIITRESEKTKTNKFDSDYKIGGGKSLIFDSSLIARIERASWVYDKKKDGNVIGERHRFTIHKTKVAGKSDKVIRGYFHTSNGVLLPEGFDRARDVLEMAKQCGVVAQRSSWLDSTLTGESWNGELKAVKALSEDVSSLADMERAVREHFVPEEVADADPDS